MTGATDGGGPSGLRVFIVEDESLVAMFLEDTLAEIGCTIAGIASQLSEAKRKLSTTDFDAVILDVNLSGSRTFEIAAALARDGIPFVFSTGYGADGLPESFRRVPVVSKPFDRGELERALTSALGPWKHDPRCRRSSRARH